MSDVHLITFSVAMAKQVPNFGDMYNADIILQLSDPVGVGYRGNPVYLYSQVLRKSKFYNAMLSDRWSSDKSRPLEISVASTHGVEEHIKCIQLMYSYEANTRFCFSSVDDALAILPAASELLFQECVEGCMQYLNAVRWSPVQEAKIRSMISSLQLNNLPIELNDRLCTNPGKSLSGGLQFLVQSIQDMLSTASKDSYSRSKVEKFIAGYLEATDPSSPVAVACRCVLVKEFSVNLELIKRYNISSNCDIRDACATLLCVVEVIQHCDTDLFQTVLQMFSYDDDLRFALNSLTYRRVDMKDVLEILINRFLRTLGNGGVVTPTSFRVFFLTNWIETMVKLVRGPSEEATLAREIINVAETLPMVDKRIIYQNLKEAFRDNFSARSGVLEWWGNTLQDAITSGKITGT